MDPSPAAPPPLTQPPAPLAMIPPSQVWDTLSPGQQHQVLQILTLISQDLLKPPLPKPEVRHD